MKLRDLRLSKNLSQGDLAFECRKLGAKISQGEISNYEVHMGYLPPAYRRALAEVLGVKPEDIE